MEQNNRIMDPPCVGFKQQTLGEHFSKWGLQNPSVRWRSVDMWTVQKRPI